MNTIQIPADGNLVNPQVSIQRKKKIMYKTNPLVKVRRFPTFGDIKKNIDLKSQ